MPAKWSWLRCRHVCTVIAFVLFVPAGLKAQTGKVMVNATVSETVALSVLPNSTHGNVETDVMGNRNTVRIVLSGGAENDAPVVRVPLLVRSNSSFRIAAVVESKTAELVQLSVLNVRATGTLVSPQAISDLNVPRQFDLRGLKDGASSTPNLPNNGLPLLVASGPRVSLGGTLDSPNNALQVTVLIRLKPQPTHEWSIHLTFVASPE